jgi:hypothetical protein
VGQVLEVVTAGFAAILEDRHGRVSYAIVRRARAVAKARPSIVFAFPRLRFRGPVGRVVLCAIAFRVVSAGLAFLTNVAFPDENGQSVTMFGTASPFWDGLVRHDAEWYFQIARNGFRYAASDRDTIAFFPAYPLLMRYVGRTFGRSPADLYVGGIVVSWTAFVVGAAALYRLAALDLPPRRAARTVLYAAIFPFAFVFGVVDGDSTLLLFTVLAFYCFRTRRWLVGGACGAVAAATRATGVLLLPALAWLAWRTAAPALRDRALATAGLLIVVAGVAWYSLFVYQLTAYPGGSHNPLEWFAASQRWARDAGGPSWRAPLHLVKMLLTHPYAYAAGERLAPYQILNGVAGFLFLGMVPFVWRRLGAPYGLFMLLNLLVGLSSGMLVGIGRICAVMFPAFIWLATIRSSGVTAVVCVVFSTIYTLCLALFTNGRPVL